MDETIKLNQMRQYWLGFLSEESRLDCENLWFERDDDADLLAAVREDLIQDYLAGEIDDAELAGFRKSLLADSNFVEDVALATAIFGTSEAAARERGPIALVTRPKTNWLAGYVGAFRNLVSGPVPAVALVTAIVAILIGGIVVWRPISNELTNAEVQPPVIAPHLPDSIEDVNRAVEPSQPIQNKNTKSHPSVNTSPKTPIQGNRRQTYTTLVLGAAIRGEKDIAEVSIPDRNSNLRLILPMPGLVKSYQEFSARIASADSAKTLWQKRLRNLNNKRNGEALVVTVPKGKISTGKYKLFLTGVNPGSNSEPLYERGFRILK